MAGISAKIDIKQLEQFQKKLQQISNQEKIDQFIRSVSKELAARLLAKVIQRTPVGDYSKYVTVTAKRDSLKHKKGEIYQKRVKGTKSGGTLRRGWTGETKMDAKVYAHSLPIQKNGDQYTITIINPVYYAPYVEFGHRTRGGRGWVQGQFMLTFSERELDQEMPRIIEKKLNDFMGELFNGK